MLRNVRTNQLMGPSSLPTRTERIHFAPAYTDMYHIRSLSYLIYHTHDFFFLAPHHGEGRGGAVPRHSTSRLYQDRTEVYLRFVG
jgi:hypothetical protein